MYISFNSSAVIANNALNKADKRLHDSLARLSSGIKVVNPKDNPSGLAMAKRMNAQIRGVEQATNNAGDGISIVEIADGTMTEISDMLQRMNELAVKGANGTLCEEDRNMIDEELQQLKTEITRISKETSFNGQPILDGSFDLKGYTLDTDLKVAYYSDSVIYGKYKLGALNVTYDSDGKISNVTPTAASIELRNTDDTAALKTYNDLDVTYSGNTVTLKNKDGFELKLEARKPETGTSKDFAGTTVDLVGFGAMDMQIGANEGQQLNIRIPKISLENMEISNITVKESYSGAGDGQQNSDNAIEQIKKAMAYVSSARANLGAYQNRLEHTVSSLDITSENMTAAYSRIMDTDMAEEMTEYTTLQILSQASTNMLAQANERPSQILQLLQ